VPPVDAPWNSSHGTGYGQDEGRGSDQEKVVNEADGASSAANVDRMDHGDGFGLDMERAEPTRNPDDKQLQKIIN
jgi:hypothetical protein